MFLAVNSHLDAHYIEARSRRAGAMCANCATDAHHAVLIMLLAVRRRQAACDTVGPSPHAPIM